MFLNLFSIKLLKKLYVLCIFCSSTQQAFNLHTFCVNNWSKGINRNQNAPWKPLDMSVYTPMHFHLKQVPGMFRPGYMNQSNINQRAKCKGEGYNESHEFIILVICMFYDTQIFIFYGFLVLHGIVLYL